MRPLVALVVADARAAGRLRLLLASRGYRIAVMTDRCEVEAALERERPGVVVLDLTGTEAGDVEICRRLRTHSLVPIMVITARDDRAARLETLRAGADDVLTEPYEAEELLLRLEGLRRRCSGGAPATPEPYVYRGLVVDGASHRTTLHGREVGLTPPEQRLLELLARGAGAVQSADDLLAQVWGPHAVGRYATLHLHVSRLRRKLGDDGRRPTYLLTRSRVGYLLPATDGDAGGNRQPAVASAPGRGAGDWRRC